MLVMHVGNVRVGMPRPAMPVHVRVRLSGRVVRAVLVLMMLVVHMRVLVRHRFVDVLVLMMLAQMQPHANCH